MGAEEEKGKEGGMGKRRGGRGGERRGLYGAMEGGGHGYRPV